MKIKILLFLLAGCFSLHSQVTLIIDSLPDYTPPGDVLYIAGDFNGWNPGDVNHMLSKNNDGLWEITLDGFADGVTIQYKFTRGSWETVEKGPNGEEINDRSFTFGNASTVHCIIFNWAQVTSTAAENVTIMDEEFYMPQLDRTRRIWIYLPPDYDETAKNYPVLYMHDGQNLFDQVTAFLIEWEVDETLNDLAAEGYQVPVVVGIDNGGIHRIDELTPWYNNEYGGGQGDEYMFFIVETLKPYIDANYRTLPGRANTGIIGSSLGGLITTYGALKYQGIFSKAGSFSPAYWINNDSIWDFVSKSGMQDEIRFYQNIGQFEPQTSIEQMHQMEDSLKSLGFTNISSKVIAGGDHNEATWRDDFREAYLWLFEGYANGLYENVVESLHLAPNPVEDFLFIQNIDLNIQSGSDFRITDTLGKIMHRDVFRNDKINVKFLPKGIYIITIESGQKIFTGKFIKQ